ncbi:AraC family transcriptional regulator [Nocardioides sp. LHG3406-4]|uniref:AraC family transcriptional regulator n=1 Tax=Nocardioides sp. LHG3406-4 TaxID=2804575 RepID=UPI003CFA1643
MDIGTRLAELRTLILRHASRGSEGGDGGAGLAFSVVRAPTAPTSSIAEPVLALVAQGVKRLAVGEQVFDYGAGEYVVVTVDLPVTGFFAEASEEAPFLGVGLDLRPEIVASLLLDQTAPAGAGAARPGIGVARAPAGLLDAVLRRVRLLDEPADARVLQPLVEREIMWRLLASPQGAIVRQIGLADSSLTHVGRTIRWIRTHYAEPFRVEELADQAGLSTSAYHRQFRAVTTMSPIQFQKRIRLQQARLLLASGAENATGAAYSVGYDNLSQFTREYRREFGMTPGRDAAGLRPVTVAAPGLP